MAQRVQTIVSVVDDLDNSVPATRTRTFAVGRRRYKIDLSEENAERFDREMRFWTKAAERLPHDDEPWPDSGRHRSTESPLETIVPVPVKGQAWWSDPPRPFSRATQELFADARRRVRRWALVNGWSNLGARGMVPREAYDRWFDEVWSALDEPSWEALDAAEAEAHDSAARPARRRNTMKK
ncbi:Lsr2 dimerization domain-containing protein [Amycolatopsis anabasis]|uniref:Lsr2 dimerization domain-containing protein n=1 Tax=Amycolatopsis anabasis TaxID=1840409 RepID=UPI00131C3D3A|nr:histone-like nucleoid-structuring protein Lsr2 [Amycolatopsis anabasis]